jgi:iron complex transport system substrate-binding protein
MPRLAIAALCLSICAAAAQPPQRIVSLSPDLTEILYGVGAFSRVVAVSDYDTYPPETQKLPHIGQLNNPSYETLTALRPDLVLVNKAQAPFVDNALKDLGLRTLTISNQSVTEVYEAMLTIGRATGTEAQAMRLVDTTRAGLQRIAHQTAGLPRRPVVLVIDRTPGTLRELYTATDGSYLAELVSVAGGRIAISPDPRGYRQLRKEDLLRIDPEIILDFQQGPKSRFSADPLEAWQELPELRAVRTHQVCSVNEDFVPHASQRMVLTAQLFEKLIHPEIQQ